MCVSNPRVSHAGLLPRTRDAQTTPGQGDPMIVSTKSVRWKSGAECWSTSALHGPEGRLRPLAIPSVKARDDLALEVRTRMDGGDLRPLRERRCRDSRCPCTSCSTPAVRSATSGSMCSGTPGVVCSAIAVHTRRMLPSGTPRAWRKRRASSALSISKRLPLSRNSGPAQVVEHRANVQELGIEADAAVMPQQAAEVEDAARVVIDEIARGVADELGCLDGNLLSGTRTPPTTRSSSCSARRYPS